MKLKKKLKWGETPWDDLSRDDLLRTVQRMYSALNSCGSILRMQRAGDEASPFWNKRGSGFSALQKTEFALKGISDEDTFRAFFRYANDLLFPDVPGVGSGWMLCGGCDSMFGIDGKPEGSKCSMCKTPMSPLTWADMEPK